MIILGIETSSDICGAAIAKDEALLSEIYLSVPNAHSENLFSCIEKSIGDAKIGINDLSGIAVSCGPGSFTGLRIGVSAAKGIAYALDIPIYMIPTLDIAAQYGAESEFIICSIIPSIRGEYFFALYKNNNSGIERVSEYQLGKLSDIGINESNGIFFTGLIDDNMKSELSQRFKNTHFVKELSPSMGYFAAKLGCRRFINGEADSLENSEPMYLRDFDIRKKAR